MLVDPLKRTKAPLWTTRRWRRCSRTSPHPYDSQHLPITAATMKWVKNDTAVRFELEVPKDAKIVGRRKRRRRQRTEPEDRREEDRGAEDRTGQEDEVKKEDVKKDEVKKRAEERREEDGRGRREGRRGAQDHQDLYFEYDLATASWRSSPTSSPIPRSRLGAGVADDKTVVFAAATTSS